MVKWVKKQVSDFKMFLSAIKDLWRSCALLFLFIIQDRDCDKLKARIDRELERKYVH